MSDRIVSRVAVGTTREHASSVFGSDHDAVRLTTFADFGDEVDLATVEQVDLAAAPERGRALDRLLTLLDEGSPLVLRVEYAPDRASDLRGHLDVHPDVGVAGVHPLMGRVSVTLARMDTTSAHVSRLALDALDVIPPSGAATRTQTEASAAPFGEAPLLPLFENDAGTSPAAFGPPVSVRLVARGLAVMRSTTRARQLAVVGVVAVAVVVIGVSPLLAGVGGAAAQLEAVVAAITLLAVVTLAGLVLLLQRDLFEHRSALQRQLRQQHRLLRQRTNEILRHERAIRAGQGDIPFLLRHVEAIDAANASVRAELRDLAEALRRDGRP